MALSTWDPTTYLRYADERSRPFVDLVDRIGAASPRAVVDLGCGPGQLTVTLTDRWRDAQVLGLDSSPEMIDRAQRHAGPRMRFALDDLSRWRPAEPVDVIVSNAALQWAPDHRSLLPGLVGSLTPGGWLAFQVPGNFTAPSHALLRELAADPDYAPHLTEVEWPDAADAATYLEDLAALGCSVDAWETTYLHVLTGPDPVFEWISGTGARPVLQALPDDRRPQFVARYKALLAEAYPSTAYGTVLPFRRIFAVARQQEAS